jgi:hypothetical protein
MSAPLESPLGGWLKFETAGHLGEPGTTLELHDAVTGLTRDIVRASRVPGDSWRAAYVDVSRQPFVVVARDTDPKRWFAFSAPVEMGALSHWAWTAAKYGLLILYLSAGAALAVGAWAFQAWRAGKAAVSAECPPPC